MATITTPQAYPRRPTAWQSCLWKDWLSCYPMVAIILLGILAIQAALLLLGTIANPSQRDSKWLAALYSCMVGPIMVTIACVSLLVGQEREMRTWNWTSSLPVSWQISLSSKALITACFAIVSLVVLMIVPLLIVPSSMFDLSIFITSIFLTMVSCMELFLFVGLFLLLMRETIPAIISGLVAMSACQFAIAATSDRIATLPFSNPSVFFFASLLTLSSVAVVVTSLALVKYYRWRWLLGMHSQLQFSWLPRWSLRFISDNSVSWKPTPNFTLFSLAWSQSIALRLAAAGLFIVSMIAFAFGQLTLVPFFSLATVLGASTFSGDQTKNRYRFLTDRGVTPWGMILSRFCPTTVVAIVLACVLLWILVNNHLVSEWPMMPPLFLGFYFLFFLLSALATICFRSTLLTLSMSTLGAVSLAVMFELSRIPHDPLITVAAMGVNVLPGGTLMVALWFATVSIGLTYLLVRWTRRWIVLDRNQLEWRFLVFVPLTISASAIPAAILSVTFGFLMLPSYEESGVKLLSVAELEAIVQPQVDLRPSMEAPHRFNDQGLILLLQVLDPRSGAIYDSVGTRLRLPESNPRSASGSKAPMLEQIAKELNVAEEAFSSERFQPEDNPRYAIDKKKLVLRYLLATKLAFLKEDSELAIRAFKTARTLIRSEDVSSFVHSSSLNSSIWQILSTLKDAEMEHLGVAECKEILDHYGKQRMEATIRQWTLCNGSAFVAWLDNPSSLSPRLRKSLGEIPSRPLSIAYFPPIRWYLQRNCVSELSSFQRSGLNIRQDEERVELETRINSLLARP